MLNDDNDRQMQRNHLLAILLMTLLVVGWMYFFMPPPPNAPAPEAVTPSGESAPAADTPAERPAPSAAPPVTDPDSPLAWLPPAAEEAGDPLSDEVVVGDEGLELVFTRVGARLKRATVVLGREGADSAQLVPPSFAPSEADAVYPLGLRFAPQFWGEELNRRRWDAALMEDGRGVRFTLEAPDRARVVKWFRLSEGSNTVRTGVEYLNLSDKPQLLGLDTREPAVSLTWGPDVASGDLAKGASQQFVARVAGDNTYKPTAKLDPAKPVERSLSPDWIAVWSAYFAVALKPEFEGGQGWIEGRPGAFAAGVGAPRTEVGPGETAAWEYQVYIGPTARRALAAAWPTLPTVQRFFTSVTLMDQFAKLLLAVLNWCHDNLWANYGIAIILLTLLVRVAVFPLTYKSMLSMKRMQKLAPELEKLKQECGENQQEFQKRTMELYKERGVNPLGGCLPLLLQMPVFFALYRMLWNAFELRRAPFMWIADLSEPDRLFSLPFSIPLPFSNLPLDSLNLLPILSAAAMYASQKLMPPSGPVQNPQQKMMMNLMPILFSVFMYNLASGLNLYILVSTMLGIAQNFVIQGANVSVEPVKKKPKASSRGRHFYTAAQAKKREMAKEVRREKEKQRGHGKKNS